MASAATAPAPPSAATLHTVLPPAARVTETASSRQSAGVSDSGTVVVAMRPAIDWSVWAKLALQMEAIVASAPKLSTNSLYRGAACSDWPAVLPSGLSTVHCAGCSDESTDAMAATTTSRT